MALEIEYLEHAVVEAAAAAAWYAERSLTAAAEFAAELDAAELAIKYLPHAWPPYDHGTRRYFLRRYPFGVVYRVEAPRILIVAWRTVDADLAIGTTAFDLAWLTAAAVDPA